MFILLVLFQCAVEQGFTPGLQPHGVLLCSAVSLTAGTGTSHRENMFSCDVQANSATQSPPL